MKVDTTTSRPQPKNKNVLKQRVTAPPKATKTKYLTGTWNSIAKATAINDAQPVSIAHLIKNSVVKFKSNIETNSN